jgi:hypothetical protein
VPLDSSSVPSLGSFSVDKVALKLEDALPHAGALWAESLRSLGAAARSLLAKVLLDRQTRKVGHNVLGRLESLGLTARRPAVQWQKEGLCD